MTLVDEEILLTSGLFYLHVGIIGSQQGHLRINDLFYKGSGIASTVKVLVELEL